VAFIGLEQHEDVEAGGGSTVDKGGHFNVSVTGVKGTREERKWRCGPLLEGEEEEASSSRCCTT
jgi:hypothetical protein